MPQLAICNLEGEKIGQVELNDEIFGVGFNEGLVHQAVVTADSRRKRHAGNVKRRGEVVTSGRKMWRQKGLGRARHGDQGAPLFVGGGKAHAPKPRSGDKAMPKKMRRKALFCALSEAARRGRISIIEGLEMKAPKTKAIVAMLDALSARSNHVLLLLSADEMADENIVKSCRNVSCLCVRQSPHLNARDVLWAADIIFTQDAVAAMDRLAGEEQ